MTDPLLAALNAVMLEVGYVQKDKKNDFHNYRYAGEESLLTVLRPVMVKHGLVLIPSLDGEPTIDPNGNTHLIMAYTLAHISGATWPEKIRVPGCGNDKNKNGIGDKGTYKALTGANKYLLFKLFQIATGDDPEVESAHDRGEAPADQANTKKRGVTAIKKDLRDLSAEMHACKDLGAFDLLVAGARHLIEECQVQIPVWYHGDGSDSEGLAKTIERRRAELKKPPPTAIRPGTMNPHQPFDNPPPF